MLSVLVLVSYKLKLSCVCVCVLHVGDFFGLPAVFLRIAHLVAMKGVK